MAVIQDTFNSAPARGFAGMNVDGETANVISRTCEDSNGIAFGAPAYRGAGDYTCASDPDLGATAAALGTNTGNGAMGAITLAAEARVGVYVLTVIEPGTNVGTFIVRDPDGVQIGDGVVGTAFDAGGLAFTLADGSTDFVAGDSFAITVAGSVFLGIALADKGIQPLPGDVAADIYPRYSSVAIKTAGAVCVVLSDDVVAGDAVRYNSGYTAGTGALLPGWVFDESGAADDIVAIVRR